MNFVMAGAFTLLGPCDEPLPPYSEPELILEGAMRTQYICAWASGNRMVAYLDVTNVYDETLDDTVRLEGTIAFRSVRMPDIKRTFAIGPDEISSGTGYNPITRRLTLDPGETLVFSVSWDLSYDDTGVDRRSELFTFYDDPLCNDRERCIAVREEFIISGEVVVFGQRAPVKATMVFPLCYYSAALAPPFFDCTAEQTEPRALLRPIQRL